MEHPWNGPFLAFLGPNSPKYGAILLKFGPELGSIGSKTLFQEFFENSNFYQNRTALFFSFCPTLTPFFCMKEAEIEKTKYFLRQNYTIELSKNRKMKALSCPNFWQFFAEKGRAHTLKSWNQNLT